MADEDERKEYKQLRADLLFSSLLKGAANRQEDIALRECQSSHSQGMNYYGFRQSLEREFLSNPSLTLFKHEFSY